MSFHQQVAFVGGSFAAQESVALNQLDQALAILPLHQKSAYIEAVQRVPGLVEMESNPLYFLRFEHYNAWEAAQRLVAYWERRKLVFAERAFLPLTLEEGALTAEDVELLETGFFAILPNDVEGRSVLYYDASLLPEGISLSAKMRVAFYLYSILCENVRSQNDGYTGIILLPKIDETVQHWINLVVGAFPCRARNIHLLTTSGTASLVQPTMRQCLAKLSNNQHVVHIGDTIHDLAGKLQIYGISRSNLPPQVGGSLNNDYLASWKQQRASIEGARYSQKQSAQPSRSVGTTEAARFGECFDQGSQMEIAHQVDCCTASAEMAVIPVESDDECSVASSIIVESVRVLTPALRQQLDEAIQLIPKSDRAAYMEAMERVPHLVETEHCPLRFLRSSSFDIWAAARRLVNSWKLRKQFFGERAFLPLTATGEGALSPEDLKVLNTGFITILPNDSEGRSVICFMRYKLAKTMYASPSRLRCIFYMLSKIAQNELSQTQGFVHIRIVDFQKFSWNKANQVELMEMGSCLKIHSMHIICKQTSFVNVLIPTIAKALRPHLLKRLVIHEEHSSPAFLEKMLTYGISVLPKDVGGTWSHEDFLKWREEQTRSERARYEQKLPAGAGNTNEKALATRGLPGTRAFYSNETVALSAADRHHREKLEEALRSLPREEKDAYLEALERAPDLIEIEPDPLRFMICEDYNAEAAALRLTRYWRLRKQLFGAKAFLPITQTGEGALSEDDFRVLRTGWCTLLPNDSYGRSVIQFDRSKLETWMHPTDKRFRCVFYMMLTATENPSVQKEGIVILRIYEEESFGANNNGNLLDILLKSMPMRLHAVHLLFVPRQAPRKFTSDFLIPILMRLLTKFQAFLNVHTPETEEQLVETMRSYGIVRDGLPTWLGGAWSLSNYLEWTTQRLFIEKQRDTRYHFARHSAGCFPTQSFPHNASNSMYGSVSRADSSFLFQIGPRMSSPPDSCSDPERLGPSSVKNIQRNGPLIRQTGRREAAFDLFNSETLFSETSESQQRGLERVEECLQRMAEHHKKAYLEARVLAPQLIEKESDPIRFLQCQKYDASAAASQLVSYWELRKELFGQSAFLPMTQTGEGALSKADINILSSGSFIVLPNDSKERSVLCYDETRLIHSSTECRLRVAFYLLTIAAENDLSQKDGFVLLFVSGSPPFCDFQETGLHRAIQVVPVRLKACHALHCQPAFEAPQSNVQILDMTRQLFGPDVEHRTVVHAGQTKQELLRRLKAYGLSKDKLPHIVGGDFGCEKFVQWQELRTRVEWNIPFGTDTKEVAKLFDYKEARSSAFCTEEEKAERKRRMNVIHSRRKRERERIAVDMLNEQCSQLKDQNELLTAENKRYTEMIEYAKMNVPNWEEFESDTKPSDVVESRISSRDIVDQAEGEQPRSEKPLNELTEEERKERKRKQNAIHSRRKRERERIEIQMLNEQCDELRQQNKAVSRENKSFEDLLQSAIAYTNRLDAFGALNQLDSQSESVRHHYHD